MYKLLKNCRACGFDDLQRVADFGVQPLANDFKRQGEPRCGFYPLEVLWCPSCTLAQLSVVVDPHVLYDRYSYVTSTSQTMKEHFNALVNQLCVQHGGQNLGSLLEIGSNDGAFLEFSKLFSKNQVGVDPAKNLCAVAETRGIRSVNALWGVEATRKLDGEKFDTVVARHVFAHCDDWKEFIACIEEVTNRDSVVCIEVPYAANLIHRCEFDTIYHEHLSYVTIRAMHALLRNTRFKVDKVVHYPIHGGSVAFILRTRDWVDHHGASLVDCENDMIGKSDWVLMRNRSNALVHNLITAIDSCDRPLIGYGAPAKAAIWMQLAGITHKEIQLVHDTTPQKQGTFVPGTSIPVVEYSPSLNHDVKTAIMFCWNFEDEVNRNEKPFINRGGQFILPLGNNHGSNKVNP